MIDSDRDRISVCIQPGTDFRVTPPVRAWPIGHQRPSRSGPIRSGRCALLFCSLLGFHRRRASTVRHKRESRHRSYGVSRRTAPLYILYSGGTSLRRETISPFAIRITVSHRFHEDLAAIAHDLQQRKDSFTPIGDNSHELLEALS